MTQFLISIFGTLSRFGRFGLVAGLVAGLALPGLAQTLKLWLPQLVMALLLLVALRIGAQKARQGLSNLRATLGIVLAMQLGLPLAVIAVAQAFGIAQSAYVLAAVLVFAAPALSGSPSLATLLNADPEPAFRLLIVGTCLLPLTIVPIFWILPQFGDLQQAVSSALRTLAVIVVAMGGGFALRAFLMPNPQAPQIAALDGAMTLAMVVIVVGLMAGLRPALSVSVNVVGGWMALAFAVNIGSQIITFQSTKRLLPRAERVPISIVSGNRNIAIFLVALSPTAAEPLLIFLGCYQVPMYLTPILMRRFYR